MEVVELVDVMLRVVELVLENVDGVVEVSEDVKCVGADVDEMLAAVVPEVVELDKLEEEEVEGNELEEVEDS